MPEETTECEGYQSQEASGRDAWGSASAGYYYSCAIDAEGALHCWGNDDDGEVSDAPSGTFTSVSAGGEHNCAIDTNGTLSCWGNDDEDQVSSAPGSL